MPGRGTYNSCTGSVWYECVGTGVQAYYNRVEAVLGHSLVHNNKVDGIIRLNTGILSRGLEGCSEAVGGEGGEGS